MPGSEITWLYVSPVKFGAIQITLQIDLIMVLKINLVANN